MCKKMHPINYCTALVRGIGINTPRCQQGCFELVSADTEGRCQLTYFVVDEPLVLKAAERLIPDDGADTVCALLKQVPTLEVVGLLDACTRRNLDLLQELADVVERFDARGTLGCGELARGYLRPTLAAVRLLLVADGADDAAHGGVRAAVALEAPPLFAGCLRTEAMRARACKYEPLCGFLHVFINLQFTQIYRKFHLGPDALDQETTPATAGFIY